MNALISEIDHDIHLKSMLNSVNLSFVTNFVFVCLMGNLQAVAIAMQFRAFLSKIYN